MPRSSAPVDETAPPHVRFYSVRDAAKILAIAEYTVYELLDGGVMESRYFGRRRLIVAASLHAFADSLPAQRESA